MYVYILYKSRSIYLSFVSQISNTIFENKNVSTSIENRLQGTCFKDLWCGPKIQNSSNQKISICQLLNQVAAHIRRTILKRENYK